MVKNGHIGSCTVTQVGHWKSQFEQEDKSETGIKN